MAPLPMQPIEPAGAAGVDLLQPGAGAAPPRLEGEPGVLAGAVVRDLAGA
jgi:hypothetical protein